MKKEILLDKEIDIRGRYELEKYHKGYKIPIVSDVMFQTMLNNSNRKQYVSYLISLSLDKPYEKVFNNIEFMKNKINKEHYYVSNKCVDLVVDLDNELVNIEVNNNGNSKEMLERNISYLFDLYKSKMKIGKDYNYQKVVQININNFSFKDKSDWIETYQLINEKGNSIFTDKIKIINIYLPKIRNKYYNKVEISELEKLLLVYNEHQEDKLKELSEGNDIMEEYIKDAGYASDDNDIIGLYDKELHESMMKATDIKNATEKGFKQGIEEGIEQGVNKRNIEIAKNLLKNNVPLEIIISSTGLSKEDVESLKLKLN